MIAKLVRHDQPVRVLGVMVPLAALLGVAAALAYGENSAHRIVSTSIENADDRVAMVVQLTLTFGVWFFAFCQIHLRAHPHHLGLPLSTRQLWGARMIAITLGMGVPVVVGCLAYFVINGNAPSSPHVEMALNFAAILFLAPLVYHSRRTASYRADETHRVLHWAVFTTVMLTAEILVAIYRPPFAIVGPGALLVGAILAVAIYRSLPRSFEVVRRKVQLPFSDLGSLRAPRLFEIPVLSPFAPLNRALRLSPLLTLNMVSLGASSLVFMNVALARSKYVEMFILSIFQVMFFGMSLISLPMVSHLPISKTRLFVQCYAPGLLLALLAVAVGLRADQSLTLVGALSSRTAAAGCAVYVLVCFVCMAAFLVPLLPPAVTRRGHHGAWAARIACGLLALGAFAFAVHPAFQSMEAAERSTAATYDRLVSWIPGPVAVVWILVMALAVASVIALRALFGRIELTWLASRMQKWLEKFA